MQASDIDTANAAVLISFVCNKIGMQVPDLDVQSGRPFKTYCPQGDLYHDDRNQSKAFKIYPNSNSAYCFACSEYFSPVSLYAKMMDMPFPAAATALLRLINYQPPAELWESSDLLPPSAAALADALQVFCSRVDPSWQVHQFDSLVAGQLNRCLALLDRVNTEDDAAAWLQSAKNFMAQELRTVNGRG